MRKSNNSNNSSNSTNNSMNQMKYEIANELGVNLESKNLTAKEAGKVGGEMTRRLVEAGKNR